MRDFICSFQSITGHDIIKQNKISAQKQSYHGDSNSDILIEVVTSYRVELQRKKMQPWVTREKGSLLFAIAFSDLI